MNIGFVGMGNMGQMLVTALTRSGALDPGQVFVSNRSREKLDRMTERVPGVHLAYHNGELAKQCGVVFLCVKPGETRNVLAEMGAYITPDHLLVTITNTLDIAGLEHATKARVAKVIPSVVQTVSEGVSLLMFGERCVPADIGLLDRLFSAISTPMVIQESQARVASDLTSCGPAFIAYSLRALAQAAARYTDLPADQINAMIRHTTAATCRLMEQVGYSIDDIIAKVSTPGGVTADGIGVLDEQMAGVWEQVIETTICKENAKKAKVQL